MKNDLIYLITPFRVQQESGFYSERYVRREVFAEVKSATRSEHYSAERAGKRAQVIVVVNDRDYQISVIDEVSKKYEAETIHMDGNTTSETVVPHIRKEPEYVEIDNVRYRIERSFKDPAGVNRELTLTRAE